MAASGIRAPGLVVDLRQGERLSLSGPATVELLHKSGQAARLRVVASPSVKIERSPVDGADEQKAVPSMAV